MDEESRVLAEQAKAHEEAFKAQQQEYKQKLKGMSQTIWPNRFISKHYSPRYYQGMAKLRPLEWG